MKNQIKSLYDAALEVCSYCKASAETQQMTEHECLAKPIYDVADELMQLCSRMEELERIESTNRALGIRLHEVELERDRYFQQKQENGKIVGDLKTELRALRKLLPDVDCAS